MADNTPSDRDPALTDQGMPDYHHPSHAKLWESAITPLPSEYDLIDEELLTFLYQFQDKSFVNGWDQTINIPVPSGQQTKSVNRINNCYCVSLQQVRDTASYVHTDTRTTQDIGQDYTDGQVLKRMPLHNDITQEVTMDTNAMANMLHMCLSYLQEFWAALASRSRILTFKIHLWEATQLLLKNILMSFFAPFIWDSTYFIKAIATMVIMHNAMIVYEPFTPSYIPKRARRAPTRAAMFLCEYVKSWLKRKFNDLFTFKVWRTKHKRTRPFSPRSRSRKYVGANLAQVLCILALATRAEADDVNVYQGTVDVIIWEYLTDTNAWFSIDAELMSRNLFLFLRMALEFYGNRDWDTHVSSVGGYTRFSFGPEDWRWVYGNNPS